MHLHENPIYEEFVNDALRPPSGDEYLAAFSEAMVQTLVTNAAYKNWLFEHIEHKAAVMPFNPSHAAGMTQKLIQMRLMQEHEQYPNGFDDVDIWKRVIAETYEDPKHRDLFEVDMSAWHIQTNIPQRYNGPLIAALLHQRKTDIHEPYEILDVGCSRNHGLTWMDAMSRSDTTTQLAPLVRRIHDGSAVHEQKLNELMASTPLKLGASYGVDLWPIRDPVMSQWQAACVNPKELLNPLLRRQHAFLERHRDDREHIRFVEGDFSEPHLGSMPAAKFADGMSGDVRFDMVIFSTICNQLSPEKLERALENANRKLKPHGVIVVNDFLGEIAEDASGSAASRMKLLDRWRTMPFMYKTVVIEKDSSEIKPFATWENGRCGVLIPEGDLLTYVSS